MLTLGTAIGFLLLVIPGLVFMAYFSISPAIVKIEHRGVWASMRRARELVRGNFRRVMLIVVGTILGTEIAVSLISESFHGVAAVTLIDLAADGLLQPIEGLVIVVSALASARAARRSSGAGGARRGRRRRPLRPGSLKTNGPPPRAARKSNRRAGVPALGGFLLPLARVSLPARPSGFIGKNCGLESVIPREAQTKRGRSVRSGL